MNYVKAQESRIGGAKKSFSEEKYNFRCSRKKEQAGYILEKRDDCEKGSINL